ncbi:LysR family transcriptional regulator [Vibrio olivae]|uniref:LysR family transcriptional regulator n=1 Tax=Vibrio olivae TaxID=1243002 RepID=A0ABV5HQM7_9VIBR
MTEPLDLNLLKVLILINKHRQLRPVAKELGKTESAVSKYLAKLRIQLDDTLFVRGAHRLEPTEFTLKLLPQISAGLDLLDGAIARQEFIPQAYDKVVRIALPEIVQHLIGADLMVALWEVLPKAQVQITNWHDLTPEHILDNKVDIGVQYFNPMQTKSIYQQKLGRVVGSIVSCEDDKLKTAKELLKRRFVVLEMKGWHQNQAIIKTSLEEVGIEINSVGTIDNMHALLDLVRKRHIVSLLPNIGKASEDIVYHSFSESGIAVDLPNVVANYKALNMGSPLHVLLYKTLKDVMFPKAN